MPTCLSTADAMICEAMPPAELRRFAVDLLIAGDAPSRAARRFGLLGGERAGAPALAAGAAAKAVIVRAKIAAAPPRCLQAFAFCVLVFGQNTAEAAEDCLPGFAEEEAGA